MSRSNRDSGNSAIPETLLEAISAVNDLPNSSALEQRAPAAAVAGKSFPRQARLLKRADFDRVYNQGARQFGTHITVFFARREAGPARIGLTVGRALGGAVDRNRIKRRLREAARLHYALLPAAVDVVIHPKKSVLRTDFNHLCAEISRAFESVRQKSSVFSQQLSGGSLARES